MNRYLLLVFSGAIVLQVILGVDVCAAQALKASGFRGVKIEAKHETQPAGKTVTGSGCSAQGGPTAFYSDKARKTFFAFCGHADASAASKPSILISYFDHEKGTVARPTIVSEQQGDVQLALAVDGAGHIWIVAAGDEKGGSIFKSTAPLASDQFERVADASFSYPQAWYMEGNSLVLDTNRNKKTLTVSETADGIQWNEPKVLAAIANGHEHITGISKNKIGIAFNVFADEKAGAGTNIYYIESPDKGKTWTTAAKENLELPLKEIQNKALVFDYAAAQRFVLLKDINFDARGFPTILAITCRGTRGGLEGAPYLWATARWTGRDWEISGLIRSDHYCDSGCFAIEDRNLWRLFASTEPGAERWTPGGEVVMWLTDDFGRSWQRELITSKSPSRHHNIRRPVNAQPEFYVLWTDDNASGAHLYFANRDGKAFILPTEMSEDAAKPEPFGRGPATAAESAPDNK